MFEVHYFVQLYIIHIYIYNYNKPELYLMWL
jgi:hypothetical protein